MTRAIIAGFMPMPTKINIKAIITREGTDWAAPIIERIILPIFSLPSWVTKILIATPMTIEKVSDIQKIKMCTSSAEIILSKLFK